MKKKKYPDYSKKEPKQKNCKREQLKCDYCNKLFWRKQSAIKKNNFCSRKCRGRWMSENLKGENGLHWQDGKITRYCIECGKKFTLPKCHFKRGKGLFCSKKCWYKWFSENISGENHPSWMGGKSFEPYGIGFNKKLKEQIRKRDNYTCQECRYTEKQLGRKLNAHHINYNKLDNRPENLISLCKSCHCKTNFKREDWIKYFQHKLREQI